MKENNIKNIDEIKSRLLYFAEIQRLPKGKFFDDLGVKASNFSGKNSSSQFGSDKIVRILNIYPDLSPDWLLLGNKPMLRSAAKPHAQSIAGNNNTIAGGDNVTAPPPADASLTAFLKEQIAIKDRQIESLIAQSSAKDRQIESLIAQISAQISGQN